MIFEKEIPFVIHKHSVGDKIDYQLSIMTENDELEFLQFPRTGNMATISDSPNITRLFGTRSEDTRSEGWLTFEGTTLEKESESDLGVYEIFDSGTVKFGERTRKYTELFFNGDKVTDRWILRKIPNVFDKAMFSEGSPVYLFWKPPKQKSYDDSYISNSKYKEVKCECPTEKLSAKFAEISKDEGEVVFSKMSTDIMFNGDAQTFEGVAAAEGTWIDLYGEKYTYTKEFIIHTFNKQRDFLKSGEKVTLNTEHPEFNQIQGEITDVQLYQEPIYHIRVKGIYKGDTDLSDDQYGLSYEFRLRSKWNEEFQCWVPFDAITDKISVVKKPACKICWINKVN